jgi:hypothetical protein
MHPWAGSVREITELLNDKGVNDAMYKHLNLVTAIHRDKLKNGAQGWVIETEGCDMEVEVVMKRSGRPPHPGFPGGSPMVRSFKVLGCR